MIKDRPVNTAERDKIVLDDENGVGDAVWWLRPDEEIGRAMVACATKYAAAQESRREQTRRYVQLFKGQVLSGSVYDSAGARSALEDAHPSWNGLQEVVNTAGSMVVRNRVRVAVQTSGADWTLQEKAKQAELFIAGVFAGNKLYERIDPLTWQDGAVPGLGATLVDDDGVRVILERIIPDELVFSDIEAIYGNPRQLFRVKWMSRWAASRLPCVKGDPAKLEAIRTCQSFNLPLANVSDVHIPLIPVWTAWFLPSAPDANDGRRVIGIPGGGPGCTLGVRPWTLARFPISFFRVEYAPAGLWGIGMAERLAGLQYRLNELNYLIEEAARLGSVGKWLVESGSNVNPDDFTDEQGGIIGYTKTAPDWKTINGIPADLLNERNATREQMHRTYGLSEWAVTGTQPDNIESGEGLRQLRDQDQGRAVQPGQHWEDAHVDLAECVVLVGGDLHKRNPKLAVTAADPMGSGLTTINFSEIADLFADPNQWVVRPYPTAILPNTPTARFEKLHEWRKAGMIDETEFAALSEMPDTDQEASLLVAGLKAVRHQITQIVRKGEEGYEPPDEAMPLQLAVKLSQATYLRGLQSGMPEDRLALLRAWRDDAMALMAGPAAPGTTSDVAQLAGGAGTPPAPAPMPGAPLLGLPPGVPTLAGPDTNAGLAPPTGLDVGLPPGLPEPMPGAPL